MHNYNPPNKYSHTTRMGNWSEEWELEEVKYNFVNKTKEGRNTFVTRMSAHRN